MTERGSPNVNESISTTERFVSRLEALQSDAERDKLQRYFKTGNGEYGAGNTFLGVRMGEVFALAKTFIAMPLSEIERLLRSPLHEARAGGLSVMDKQARLGKTPDGRRADLFDLYVRRHDRINNWDLVDLAAPYVFGHYLFDHEQPRDILYRLVHSSSIWERRTAIVSTAYFIRQADLDDTFRIAELLNGDEEDLIHKATGGWLRAAGAKVRPRLLAFFDRHAATMPRFMLRYAIEHLDADPRRHYLGLKR